MRYTRIFSFFCFFLILVLSSCKKNELVDPESDSDINFYFTDGTESVISAKPLSKGGMVYVGEANQNGFVIVLDNDGKLVWRKIIGGDKKDGFSNVIETSNGDILAVGGTKSKSDGYTQGYAVRLNSAGSVVWEKYFGYSQNNYFYNVVEDPNGDLILIGAQQPFGADSWILKLNSSGNQIWEQILEVGPYHDIGKAVITGSDGDYIIAGICNPTNFARDTRKYQTYMVKLDRTDGNIVWGYIYTDYIRGQKVGLPQGPAISLFEENDGYSWITSYEEDGPVGAIQMIKTNFSGDVLWEKRYRGKGNAILQNAFKTEDNGYMVLGGSSSKSMIFANVFQNSSNWMLKLNQSGGVQWESHVGSDDRIQYSFGAFKDGNYWYVGGSSMDPITSMKKLTYYKTDEKGELINE
jgi:hypothetical protein